MSRICFFLYPSNHELWAINLSLADTHEKKKEMCVFPTSHTDTISTTLTLVKKDQSVKCASHGKTGHCTARKMCCVIMGEGEICSDHSAICGGD